MCTKWINEIISTEHAIAKQHDVRHVNWNLEWGRIDEGKSWIYEGGEHGTNGQWMGSRAREIFWDENGASDAQMRECGVSAGAMRRGQDGLGSFPYSPICSKFILVNTKRQMKVDAANAMVTRLSAKTVSVRPHTHTPVSQQQQQQHNDNKNR